MVETIAAHDSTIRDDPDALFQELLEDFQRSASPEAIERLRDAYAYSKERHDTGFRLSGHPYIHHCVEVARTLYALHMDIDTLIAGLLHDVIEDTETKIEEIADRFGPAVAIIVEGMTKISTLKLHSREIQQAENFRKMLMSMAQDIRVILVKFADRLHNMRTLKFLPESKQEKIARETRDVYAPLAHRLGIARIAWELEDLTLKTLDPESYTEITRRVDMGRKERERLIEEFAQPLRESLAAAGIEGRVVGRAKHFYSIYQKMRRQRVTFDEIYDLLAVRIILHNTRNCYEVLGMLHEQFTAVSDRIRDHVGVPKANGYQSLHTTVIVGGGRHVEVQIRTEQMHQVAEEGIAAHWTYKKNGEAQDSPEPFEHGMRWLRHFLDWSEGVTDPTEFMAQLKSDLPTAEVYVFSPAGDVFELPKGATALDFAFAVHSDLGQRTLMAKVGGQVVPKHHVLNSGDRVEIIVSDSQEPTRDWLGMIVTTKAKNRINKFVKAREYDASASLGQQLLERELTKLYVALPDSDWPEIAKALGFAGARELFAGVGAGDVVLPKVLYLAVPRSREIERLGSEREDIQELKDAPSLAQMLDLEGVDPKWVRSAKCCKPVMGDPIAGHVTMGHGLSVHRMDCPNIGRFLSDSERLIELSWRSQEIDNPEGFSAEILVKGGDRRGLVHDVTGVISSFRADITAMEFQAQEHTYYGHLTLGVRAADHLNRLMDRLRQIGGVEQVERAVDITAEELADWPEALRDESDFPISPGDD